MRPTLHTDRLTLRPLAEDDLEDLVAMNGDADVMAYIGRPMSRDQVVAELPGWVDGDGDFGLWVGHATDGFAGVWFLSRDPDDATAGEIGWRLPRQRVGSGVRRGRGAGDHRARLRHPRASTGCGPRRWRSTPAPAGSWTGSA